MRTIVRVLHGAHLFGTATPESDTDFKEVIIPPLRQILLGKAGQIVSARTKPAGVANDSPDDVDTERLPLYPFLTQTAEGQSNALAMIFAPEANILEADPIWYDVLDNRHRFVTKQASGLVGYCRDQAAVYSLKGARLAAARATVTFLAEVEARIGKHARLSTVAEEVYAFVEGREFTRVEEIATTQGGSVAHLKVSDRKIALTVTVERALDMFRGMVKRYGQRAHKAEERGRFDPKSFSHALRVGYEALELMQTGRITYPRPEAEFLTAIKIGKVPLAEVIDLINPLVEQVEAAAATCPLPEEPDQVWIDDFCLSIYLEHVRSPQAA